LKTVAAGLQPPEEAARGAGTARLDSPNETTGTPNFIGLSLREAINKARHLNAQVELRGHGYVVKQTPIPGAPGGPPHRLSLTLEG
jgi:hypothetical protein